MLFFEHRACGKLLLCSSALIGSLAAAAPSFAQTDATAAASAEQAGVESVTVTARQRSEDIESVPAQVSAFTAQDIQNKGVISPSDFLDAVPNVTFIATQNAGTSFIVMRGISQARNSEPSAAVVVDGVPMTQPAQFNQTLLDIQQIEVLKGPQGALYGRNAIGGAILITTKQPTDQWEAQFTAGAEDGPGGKIQGVVSGPLSPDLKVRLAASYINTDGHLTNFDSADTSERKHADPVSDFNARASLLYTPTDEFTVDLRFSMDLLHTRALYYVIPPFGSPNFNNPNYVSQPIKLNNSGFNDRKIYDGALKLDYDAGYGHFTSITGFNSVWEILTGDGYPFAPFDPAAPAGPCTINPVCFNFDQSQFLTAKTFTQELRFTSPSEGRFKWIAGGQLFLTHRFISTGNMFDVADEGVVPIYYAPNPSAFQPQGQISFLSDAQKQMAWAFYVDTSTEITDALELSLNARYDSDHRTNITRTPQAFLTGAGIPATTGDQRSHTWDAFQPQVVLRWQATDDVNLYASWSRGFRSGGFNQTGVATASAAAGFDNVGDMFNAEIASTWEAGIKSRWLDDRLLLNLSGYYTTDHNDYYFVFLASNSTQNLGNIKGVRFMGVDLDATARITEELQANVGFGYTDSRVTDFPGASSALVVGSRAPLVSEYTANVSLQWQHPIAEGWSTLVRIDDNVIGPTTFVIPVPAAGEPVPVARDAVNLFDLRAGVQSDEWQLTAWSKNLFNKKYNTEYSTGGFLFKGEPRVVGIDITKKF